jgi:hypothetical protein
MERRRQVLSASVAKFQRSALARVAWGIFALLLQGEGRGKQTCSASRPGAWKLLAALKCDDSNLIFYASGCNWIKTKPGWRNEWLPVWPNLSLFFALRRSREFIATAALGKKFCSRFVATACIMNATHKVQPATRFAHDGFYMVVCSQPPISLCEHEFLSFARQSSHRKFASVHSAFYMRQMLSSLLLVYLLTNPRAKSSALV